jgi:hypothetical protein
MGFLRRHDGLRTSSRGEIAPMSILRAEWKVMSLIYNRGLQCKILGMSALA